MRNIPGPSSIFGVPRGGGMMQDRKQGSDTGGIDKVLSWKVQDEKLNRNN